jgi:hypothetical protein
MMLQMVPLHTSKIFAISRVFFPSSQRSRTLFELNAIVRLQELAAQCDQKQNGCEAPRDDNARREEQYDGDQDFIHFGTSKFAACIMQAIWYAK